MKILAFAGSSSKESINKKLVAFTTTLFESKDVTLLDLNDFEMPVYGIDKEIGGLPQEAHNFAAEIDKADLIIMSLAEHNGAYSVAFKNILDWLSRIPKRTVFENKPIFIMSTSPGPRGGQFVLEMAKSRFPFNGGVVLNTFSLPSFEETFEEGKGITNETLLEELAQKVKKIEQAF